MTCKKEWKQVRDRTIIYVIIEYVQSTSLHRLCIHVVFMSQTDM